MEWRQVSKRRDVLDMAVTDTHTFLAGQKGLFVSDNQGGKWKSALNGVWVNHVWAQGHEVYAGACGALHYSADYGKTWQVIRKKKNKWFGPFGGAGDLRLHGLGARSLFRQEPGEPRTWEKFPSPSGIEAIRVFGAQVWAVGRKGLVARSSDEGASWEILNPGYKTTYYDVHVDASHHITIAGLTGEVRRSTDGGQTWQALQIYGRQVWGTAEAIYVMSEHTSSSSVHRSTDGGESWTKVCEVPQRMLLLRGTSRHNIWVANYDGAVYCNA